jgi:hypothetical protein
MPDQLSLRLKRVHAPPEQMLQKQRWEEVRNIEGSLGHTGKLPFFFLSI